MTIGRLYKLKKCIHLFLVIFVHIILLIIPIIIYKIRLDNTPLAQADLDNLNRICGSTKTSESIQSSMFALCIFHSVGFGMFYGFFALKVTEEDKLYFTGRWSYRNWCCCALHSMAQLLIAAAVPVVVILGFGSFWAEGYSRFFVYNAALVVGAFMYIWLTPKL